MKIANDKNILQGRTNGKISNVLGLTTILIIGVAAAVMFVTWGI